MPTKTSKELFRNEELTGPAKDFALFSELEFERRRNSEQDFDADLFYEAVELALAKLAGIGSGSLRESGNDH